MKPLAAFFAALLTATMLAGCLLGDRCGPDEELVDNLCMPLRSDGGASDGEASADGDIAGLGEPCREQEDCFLPADICVIYPGATDGYCTIQHCSRDPDDCPEGYFCMDVSEFNYDCDTLCLQE